MSLRNFPAGWKVLPSFIDHLVPLLPFNKPCVLTNFFFRTSCWLTPTLTYLAILSFLPRCKVLISEKTALQWSLRKKGFVLAYSARGNVVHPCREGMATRGRSRLIAFHPHTGSRGREQEVSPGYFLQQDSTTIPNGNQLGTAYSTT